MADDIDIEEHDVLESLRRRQMPDAVVKQEPMDEEYAVSELHYQPSNEYDDQQWDWESQGIQPAQIKVEKPDEEDLPFGKIILGSKPPESREEAKPPEAEVVEKEDKKQNYNYNMSLILEDWAPILEASNCYCPECQTLFATVNALDAHKMIAHSFLVAMDKEASPERNKAIKSTAKPNENYTGTTCEICKFTFKGEKAGKHNLLRHYRQVHQIDPSTLKSVNELKNWKICNHCNVYFPSDTALVKHLYELLPLNDSKNDDKPTPVKVQSVVKAPNDKVTPKIVRTERKPVEVDPAPTASSVETVPTPKPIVVKTGKTTPKHANSMILGSKINGVRVDVKRENIGIPSSKLRQCEVCGVEYSRKYYLVHMRKFHSDILTVKMNRLKKNLAVNNIGSNVRYKCMMCNVIFEGPTSARKHKAQKHPEMKRKKMFLKLVQANKVQKVKNKPKVLNKVKKPPQNEDSELIVSKSTLFKCNRCSVHFLTCYGACAHSRVCETSSNIRDWSCPQCQRVFKNVDKKAHEFQHQAVNAKFKVYVVYLEMVVRILCECPCCYVCFEEYKFWRHIKFGCERDTESFFCNECRLPIDMSSKTSHESKHTQGDFTKEDFIKVDFISSNKYDKVKAEPTEKDIPVPALKRKLAAPIVAAEKKTRKAREEFNLFYCPTCKLYVSKKIIPHSTGACKKRKPVKQKISCKICGISFSPSSCSPHLRLHRKYPNLTLSDLTFIRITDDKKMKPIPEFYPCKKCRVNFLTKLMRRKHECGETKSFHCQLCQKNIEKSLYKLHMRFHTYVLPGKKAQKMVQCTIKSSPLARESEVQSPTKSKLNEPKSTLTATELPELLMKYQSLTTLWNILYVCATCDTFTDSYDKVVEHCQNHFTNMESYGVVIMKCQICNMKFDRECYRRHLELHAGSSDISRKSFKILRYVHAKLFSEEWLNFIDLPEDQKTQILTRSMYGDKRYVRMRLEQQGPPEYTLYRCKQCLKCISPDAIIHHMNLTNCSKANKIICPVCSMMFANRTACGVHQKMHETTHLEADSFRIVAFNDSSDGDLNKKILNEYNAGEVVVMEEPPKTPDFFAKYPDNVKLVKGNKFYMFYKCSDCEVCTLDAVSADHVCPTAKKICPKCGLTFSSNNFNDHTKLHDEIMFSGKNVFTRSFYSRPVARPSKDTSKKSVAVVQTEIRTEEASLFKCHCGLHFTSLKTIEKHYQSKNCSSVVREKCSHCSLVFDPNEIVNHLCKHHAKTQFQRFKIVIPNKKTVYKCKQCHVLFYDKRIGGVHIEKCDGVANGTKCDDCGLAFDKISIIIHRDEHKASGQSKLDCYLVENITNDAKIDNSVLYKCKKCNIHYIEQTSARNHVTKYNHQTHQVKKCDQCSLRFTVKTLPRHVELHHNMLKIDRFRIKCVPVGDKNNAEDKPAVFKINKETTKESIPEEVLDIDVESEMVREGRTYKIHRCKKCKMHFTDTKTLLKHNEDRCSKDLAEFCELCSLKFSAKNVNTHKKQHNGEEIIKMDITEEESYALDEDVEVDDKNDTATEEDEESRNDKDNNIYKCKNCSLHFNVKKSALRHMSDGCVIRRAPVKCEECNVSFTRISATRHKILHDKFGLKKEDFKIYLTDSWGVVVELTGINDENSQSTINTAASLDSSVEESSHEGKEVSEIKTNADLETEVGTNSKNVTLGAESSQLSEDVGITKSKTKMYKCGDCNVYFIAQRTCYKHVTQHTPLNPKDYIECKLCGFQFLIAALQTHIKKHHEDEFKLEDVLVQEYHPGVVKDNLPEYEIYFAIDKEQSALVSTSSDVNNDLKTIDSKEIENDCSEVSEVVDVGSTEVSSNCNELNEKIDALEKT